jgi:hypothetical protein
MLAPSIDTDGGNEHHVRHEKAVGSAPTLISQLAEDFANALPDRTFSPAEIQGFLLVRKNDPAQALADVAAWRHEQLQKKTRQTTEGNHDWAAQPNGLKAKVDSRPPSSAGKFSDGPMKATESPALTHVNGSSTGSMDGSSKALNRDADASKLQGSADLDNGRRALPSATQLGKATANFSSNGAPELGAPPPPSKAPNDVTKICEIARGPPPKDIPSTEVHKLDAEDQACDAKQDPPFSLGLEDEMGDHDDEHLSDDGPAHDDGSDSHGPGSDEDEDDDDDDYNDNEDEPITHIWFSPHGGRGGSARSTFGPLHGM